MTFVPAISGASEESPTRGLDEHCRQVVLQLRAALLELYDAVGADPDRPQEVSRRFRLDKSLTWKFSKILRSEHGLDVVSLIPGSEGVTRLLTAMAAAGANEQRIEKVRAAMREFDAMVLTHAGDRATLDLYLDSMHPSATMQESRRLAYLGNSGILGLQTRVRFATRIIAPSETDPSRLDLALVTGVRDLRRLRPLAPWPIYRFTRFKEDLTLEPFARTVSPLEPVEGVGEVDWLMRSWCSSPMPSVRRRDAEESVVYELVDGPVGRTGEANLTFGYVERSAVPRYATAADRHGQFMTGISLPTEVTLLDIFFHRELPEVERSEARFVTQFPGVGGDAGLAELPIPLTFMPLRGRPTHAATPLMGDYAQLMESVFETCRWDPQEFGAIRLVIEHPPLHSSVFASYDLPSHRNA